jgi:hypothetical protein
MRVLARRQPRRSVHVVAEFAAGRRQPDPHRRSKAWRSR